MLQSGPHTCHSTALTVAASGGSVAAASGHEGSIYVAHSLVQIAVKNIGLAAIRKREDDNALIFGLLEFAGRSSETQLTLPETDGEVVESIPVEKEEELLSVESVRTRIAVSMERYEINPARVDFENIAGWMPLSRT